MLKNYTHSQMKNEEDAYINYHDKYYNTTRTIP